MNEPSCYNCSKRPVCKYSPVKTIVKNFPVKDDASLHLLLSNVPKLYAEACKEYVRDTI